MTTLLVPLKKKKINKEGTSSPYCSRWDRRGLSWVVMREMPSNIVCMGIRWIEQNSDGLAKEVFEQSRCVEGLCHEMDSCNEFSKHS